MNMDATPMRHAKRIGRVGMLAVGLGIGAAMAAMPGVAFANNYDFTPDISTFVPKQVEGYPPLINEVTGAESWSISDTTKDTVLVLDAIPGTDTETTIGSFTNDDFLTNTPFAHGFTDGNL